MNLLVPRVLLLVLLAMALAYGGGRWQQSRADAERYDAQATRLALDQARVQLKAVDDARIEEQRRTAAQTKATNEAIQQAERVRADARAADTARRELLARATALANAGRRPSDSGALGSRAPAGDPLGVLADVLGRADQSAGVLAQYADAARVAGLACERSYDALTKGQARDRQ